MKSGRIAMICRMLIVSLLFFSYQSSAGMIGTESIASAPSSQSERMQIQSALSRAEVASQLHALGLGRRNGGDALRSDHARARLIGEKQERHDEHAADHCDRT